MNSSAKLDDLRALVTPDQYSERDGVPVFSPETTEEVAAIAHYANQSSLAVEIAAGGTKRGWGNPVAADLVLDTTRLNRVLEHPWQDLTCTVQAGCPWTALQQTLAQHNQFVALDPLWPGSATVGGIVATNDSGALRHRYGSPRDLIIGMTIVLADGTIAKSGGKVVKNVAGYDLHKLMTGAFGTLGIITEVTFRLHPLPLHRQTFTVSAPHAAQLAPLMAAIRDSHLLPQALQLRGNSDGFHLDIQLNAHPDANQSQMLQTIVTSTQPEIDLGFSPGIDPANNTCFSPRDMLLARESLFKPKATVIKLSAPPSDFCEYLDHTRLAANIEVATVAQSTGLIFASLAGDPAAIEIYLQSLPADFTILQTSVKCDRWKANPDSLPLMREIKHQFDPNRILNPGRFLGGI